MVGNHHNQKNKTNSMLTKEQAVQIGVPPALKDRYIVRIIDAKFGLSKSSGNPMVTIFPEIAGVPTSDGVQTEIKRNGQSWSVAGIRCQAVYFPLVAGKALGRFVSFLEAAGLPSDQIDDENHDTSPYMGLLMEAIVTSTQEVQRKVLTDEEKAEGKTVGDVISDNEGKPLARTTVVVAEWLAKFSGDLPY